MSERNIEQIGRWIREAGEAAVCAAIDRVDWVRATKTRTKAVVANFLEANPHGRPLNQLRAVGPMTLAVLNLAMLSAGPPPDPRDEQIAALTRRAEEAEAKLAEEKRWSQFHDQKALRAMAETDAAKRRRRPPRLRGGVMERECCQKCREEAELRNERPWWSRTMLVCHRCGNKRCPKIVDHRYACTNSNEPGQVGAVGEDAVIPPPRMWTRIGPAEKAALEAVARAAENWSEAYDANQCRGAGESHAEFMARQDLVSAIKALREARR